MGQKLLLLAHFFQKGWRFFMADNLEDRLMQNMAGTPKLKPDEQRRYLGTFKERVSLTLTYEQAQDDFYLQCLEDEMLAHPDYLLSINSRLNETPLNKVLHFASQHNLKTVLKSDKTYQDATSYTLVLASKNQALNLETIDVAQKYPKPTKTPPVSKHKSFWEKLFE